MLKKTTVYDTIAQEFNHTRYSVWADVRKFIDGLPKHSVGADIGCGNGKNMKIRTDITFIGSDLSWEQTVIALSSSHNDVFVSDAALCLPYKTQSLDFAICIAVIHHFPCLNMRLSCISEILRCVKPNGRVLITVWAAEQAIKKSWKHLGNNDYMIPWTMKDGTIQERFYHLSDEKEIMQICKHFEKHTQSIRYWFHMDNWYMEMKA